MRFRRYGTFTGGIDLPDEKRTTLDGRIRPLENVERLFVPLAPCGGAAALPEVKTGQRVRGDQLIARGRDGGVDIYSPADGRVASTTTVRVAGYGKFITSPAVELTDVTFPPSAGETDEPAQPRSLLEGNPLTTYRRPVEPLAAWINRARGRDCNVLIANGMENQPYLTATHRTLVEHGPQVVRGLALLAEAVGADEIFLAVDRRRTSAYEAIIAPAEKHGVRRVALPHKYPVGADNVLVKVITRREVRPGHGPTDVGAAVIGVSAALAAWRWAARGIPPTARTVTVSGPGIAPQRHGNFLAPFGVKISDIVAPSDEAAVIHGGPMTGLLCRPDAVVTPSSEGVLAIRAKRPSAPTSCIRCGWCTDHCPARLNVAALNDTFELAQVRRARRMGVAACVDCGTCSYLCPARLPLAQRMSQLKRIIRNLDEAPASGGDG